MVQAYRGCFKIPSNERNTNAVHSTRDESMKADYHPCSRPPDEVVTVGHCIIFAQLPPDLDPVALMISRIKKKGERNLKNLRNFERVRYQFERRCNETNDRRYLETGSCPVLRKATKEFDVSTIQTDLLFGLPQCGIHRRSILLLNTPARKTDLPGMVMEMICSTSQKYRRLRMTQDNRKQHGSRRERARRHALLRR